MNQDEKRAKEFLEKHYSNIQFEPVKNAPPDFLINYKIAVEVRRLNQNYFDGNKTKGLEEVDIPLHHAILEVLHSFNTKFNGTTYYLLLNFQRPLQSSIHEIKNELSKTLNEFLSSNWALPTKIDLEANVGIEIVERAEPIDNELFHLGSSYDNDTGGAIGSIFFDNIEYCLTEKSKKITKVKKNYDEWWLLLLNHIYFLGLENQRMIEFLKSELSLRNFDKLLILHPEKLEVSLSLS